MEKATVRRSCSTSHPATTTSAVSRPAVPGLGQWVDATGNLAGKPSECGNLSYLAARPDSDQVIAGVAQQGLWASTAGPISGRSSAKAGRRRSRTGPRASSSTPPIPITSGRAGPTGTGRRQHHGRRSVLRGARRPHAPRRDQRRLHGSRPSDVARRFARAHRSVPLDRWWRDVDERRTQPPAVDRVRGPAPRRQRRDLSPGHHKRLDHRSLGDIPHDGWRHELAAGRDRRRSRPAPCDPRRDLLAAQNGGVLRSTDDGATWKQVHRQGRWPRTTSSSWPTAASPRWGRRTCSCRPPTVVPGGRSVRRSRLTVHLLTGRSA